MFQNRTGGEVKGGSAVLMLAVLVASLTLLGWSIASSWSGSKESDVARQVSFDGRSEPLPPSLDSKEAKASLLYPKMKIRGPMRGGNLTAKPIGN